MRSNISSTRHEVLVGREKVPNIAALQDEQDDPVNTCDDGVERKWRFPMAVLSPYCMAMMAMSAVCRDVKGIVQGRDDHKEPGDDCQDLVGYQGTFSELGPFRKRVVYRNMSSASRNSKLGRPGIVSRTGVGHFGTSPRRGHSLRQILRMPKSNL